MKRLDPLWQLAWRMMDLIMLLIIWAFIFAFFGGLLIGVFFLVRLLS